jgi:hypothetical protein
MESINDLLKHRVGVLPQDFNDVKYGEYKTQHGSVLGQGLARFGAEEFSTETANV